MRKGERERGRERKRGREGGREREREQARERERVRERDRRTIFGLGEKGFGYGGVELLAEDGRLAPEALVQPLHLFEGPAVGGGVGIHPANARMGEQIINLS